MSFRDIFLTAASHLHGAAMNFLPTPSNYIVLTLHNIASHQESSFASIIGYINNKYGFIEPKKFSPQDIWLPETPRILLTFDDGFLSNRKMAESVLMPLGICAVFFPTYEFIGLDSKNSFDFASRYFYPRRSVSLEDGDLSSMSWADLSWLLSQGHEIGAHTLTHRALSGLSSREKRIEIIDGADQLEQKLGVRVEKFAYPFGSLSTVDEESIEIARSRFKFAFSNIRGNLVDSPSHHFIWRQNLSLGITVHQVDGVINGLLDWPYRRQRQSARLRFGMKK